MTEIIRKDTTRISIEQKAAYVAERIENYFSFAKEDYDVDGVIKSIDTDKANDYMKVVITENGIDKTVEMYWCSDYTAEQLYYIWMEQF